MRKRVPTPCTRITQVVHPVIQQRRRLIYGRKIEKRVLVVTLCDNVFCSFIARKI